MKTYEAQVKARVDAGNARIVQDARALPKDEAGLMILAAEAFADLDRAIANGDRLASSATYRRLDAITFNLAGGDLSGMYSARRRVETHFAPKPGIAPTWGLDGQYVVVVDGIKVRCAKLGAHLSLYAIDADSAFVSETGFMSCLNGFGCNGDVKQATKAAIRKLLRESGRVAILPKHRDHVRGSQPEWLAEVLAAEEEGEGHAVAYQEPTGQLAFAF